LDVDQRAKIAMVTVKPQRLCHHHQARPSGLAPRRIAGPVPALGTVNRRRPRRAMAFSKPPPVSESATAEIKRLQRLLDGTDRDADATEARAGGSAAQPKQQDELPKQLGPKSIVPLPWPVQLPIWMTPRVQGLVLLYILVLLVAANWPLLKMQGNPFDFAALRFLVAAGAMSPFLGQAESGMVGAGVELGLWNAFGYLSQSEALISADASRSSFLSAITVGT
jgi:hypothetical protein